jgi:hypothetical protein
MKTLGMVLLDHVAGGFLIFQSIHTVFYNGCTGLQQCIKVLGGLLDGSYSNRNEMES